MSPQFCRVSRRPNEVFNRKCAMGVGQTEVLVGTRGSVLVCGCFLYLNSLIDVTININQAVYFKIFVDQVLSFIQHFHNENAMSTPIFQHGSICLHKATCIYYWFDEYSDPLLHLDWLTKSPDLYSIETIWNNEKKPDNIISTIWCPYVIDL